MLSYILIIISNLASTTGVEESGGGGSNLTLTCVSSVKNTRFPLLFISLCMPGAGPLGDFLSSGVINILDDVHKEDVSNGMILLRQEVIYLSHFA